MPPTNLLFLFTDEQRFDTLAAYGNDRIEMPNLNRLASQSIVFDEAYVTQPVCTPSRASLMTGLWPHTCGCTQNNVPLPVGVAALPEMLPAGRYATAYHGKWHLGDEVFAQHGFDEWVSIEDAYAAYYGPGRDAEARSSYHRFLVDHGYQPRNGRRFSRDETARLPEPHSRPAFLAREASRFIRDNARRPFVLYVNFLEPHMPFFGPRDGQYDPRAVPLPDDFENAPGPDQPLKTRVFTEHYRRRGMSNLPLETPDQWRRLIANYWGLCSLVDTHVGTILATLEDSGLADRTLVVYTSDHGDMMGSHQLVAKCVMYQEAVRVPLLIRLAGQSAGRCVAGPVSQIDLVPTLLDCLEAPVPGHLQGHSLRPLIEAGLGAAANDDVVIEWNGPNSGIAGDTVGRTRLEELPAHLRGFGSPEQVDAAIRDPVRTIVTPDGWRFSCSPLGEHELYDLRDDPHETLNLAARPEHRPRLAELTDRLRRWQQRTGDTVALTQVR